MPESASFIDDASAYDYLYQLPQDQLADPVYQPPDASSAPDAAQEAAGEQQTADKAQATG